MDSSNSPLRVGLIGYGVAGAVFHAPLIAALPGLELASVVTANEERAAAARAGHPGVRVLADAEELLADPASHDLVVVAAPNRVHVELALAALGAGLHVVVDKPLAASLAGGERLAAAAAVSGLVAAVFHNRRYDGDFLTLRRLLDEGRLGEPWRLESRFERWRPELRAGAWRERPDPAEAGGLLFDLGSHLIDQALVLLGPARSVYAEVRALRQGAQVDDDFFLALEHGSGARSHLSGTMLAAQPGPRLRALGTRAAYVKWGLDVQEDQLRAGGSPRDDGFGEEPESAWGRLGSEEHAEPVRTELGRYVEFYERMERAILASEPAPVPLSAGIETLRIIEAARRSSDERAVVPL